MELSNEGWRSPTSVLGSDDATTRPLETIDAAPRNGMTRSRREELELWRSQKRQRLSVASSSNENTCRGSSNNQTMYGNPSPLSTSFNRSHSTLRKSLASAHLINSSIEASAAKVRRSLPVTQRTPISGITQKGGLSVRNENVTAPSGSGKEKKCEIVSHRMEAEMQTPSAPLSLLSLHNGDIRSLPTSAGEAHETALTAEEAVENNERPSETQNGDINPENPSQMRSKSRSDGDEIKEYVVSIVPTETLNEEALAEPTCEIVLSGIAPSEAVSHDFEITTKLASTVDIHNVLPESKESNSKTSPQDEYDVNLLLLANDTLLLQLADSEARRMADCARLRQERDELKLELRMQEARFKQHAQRVEDAMQQGLMVSMTRIQELTKELDEAREELVKLKKGKATTTRKSGE